MDIRVGSTPAVRIDGICVKLEHLNPSGSIKDRMAKYIVERAEAVGLLRRGYTIVEATSGNTGISFAMLAALRGYRMIAVMPRGLSSERSEIMKAYGARVVHPKHNCFICALELAKRYASRPRHYMPDQFANKWNCIAEEKLGKELLSETRVDCFVAGVGTGGTIIGVGRILKKHDRKTKIIALEPAECALLAHAGIGKIEYYKDHAVCRKHGIEGIGDGIVPDIIKRNKDVIDEVVTITTKQALAATKRLARRGYFVGPSSGANFAAAKKLKRRYKNVATVFADSGDRYLSENL